MTSKALPQGLDIARGETQIGVNELVLTRLFNQYPQDAAFSAVDLPCGRGHFLGCLRQLFPRAQLWGGDIAKPAPTADDVRLFQMDLTEDFPFPPEQQFDLVTSISGVMMFSNTLRFIKNCTGMLKPGGTFVLTNDNQATIRDRLSYLFMAKYRIFDAVFEDDELMTENVPINELVRLLRTHGIEIEDIQYTSLYRKDLVLLPLAVIAFAVQYLYLRRRNTRLPAELKWKMYPFRHMFHRHYVIFGRKKAA